jgi:hypothetical protein
LIRASAAIVLCNARRVIAVFWGGDFPLALSERRQAWQRFALGARRGGERVYGRKRFQRAVSPSTVNSEDWQ